MRSFVLSPFHHPGRFQRTIRVEGRAPRLVKFTPDVTVELDNAEAAFMAPDIANGIIGVIGTTFAEPVKPEPPVLSIFDDERDLESGDLLPERDLTNTQRFLRDIARRAGISF